ncbi:MAG: M20/M25/M40 family metallo-hydrolase [Peptococcaceae bacterium]|nr:M20/M25/M40 family metallo-hydrolase [Peptococcaceae bacterium]
MINSERMTNEFIEMVKIDSVSGKERAMADFLKLKLRELGMEAYEDDAGKTLNSGTGNIIARLPGNAQGPTVLISAHMDTVEPGVGIKPIIKDGIVRSSGDTILGGDNKAGIAIILEAVRKIRENNIRHSELELVFTIYEESGLLGAKNLEYRTLKGDIGYVLDSAGEPGVIITSAPAQDVISANIIGKSAHSGFCPEEGVNAIEIAAKAIAALEIGRIDEETTTNIGVISGGKATNIVPDSVLVQGETRSRSRIKKDMQTRLIIEKFKEVALSHGAKVDITVDPLYFEYNLDLEQQVVRVAVAAAEKSGLIPKIKSTGGGSDANIFNEMGIPSVALGIGMTNVHTTEELISIKDMEDCCIFLLNIIEAAVSADSN